MKKKLNAILAVSGLAIVALAGCRRQIVVQGISDDRVVVGNTAATSGNFAGVGTPFNFGLTATLDAYNAIETNVRKVDFKTYDDGFDQTTGINYTKRLVEEDKVFALVGHFGTPTVGGTIKYIKDKGVPMVYAATGINDLYQATSELSPVMPVQPIYRTDGRIMVARIFNSELFGADGRNLPAASSLKVGILATTTEEGVGQKVGVDEELVARGVPAANITTRSIPGGETPDAVAITAAVQVIKASNVDVIILAMNQTPYVACLTALTAAGNTSPVFSGYVNSNAATVISAAANPNNPSFNFRLFGNAWLDATSEAGWADYLDFYATVSAKDGGDAYAANAYAMAGFVAAKIFLQGLDRIKNVATDDVTFKGFIEAMESAPISVPMGDSIDFADGQRIGIDSMCLLEWNAAGSAFALSQGFSSLSNL